MRVAFAGTPAFAATALHALLSAGHELVLVLTQPDKPAGRGLKMRESEVKAVAVAGRLPLEQPVSLKSGEVFDVLRAARANVMVVAAYGLILPPALLDMFPLGCLNIHASLLPRWRGAAPIQRAILAGDAESGISIMHMERGLDTGPVYLAHRLPIAPDETAGSLHDKLAELGGLCIVQVLDALNAGGMRAMPQSQEGVTYATKIQKDEAVIDWAKSAAQIERQVRAFNPYPIASTIWRGEQLRVLRARAVEAQGHLPGRVEDTERGILVSCGSGSLLIHDLQRAGGKAMAAADFLRGAQLSRGEMLGK